MQTKLNKSDQDSGSLTTRQKKEVSHTEPSEQVENSFVTLQRKKLDSMFGDAIQREAMPEEEEPLQGKFVSQLQTPEEEEPLKGKFVSQLQSPEEEEPLQGKFVSQLQTQEEEDPLQGKFPVQKKPNETGLPDEVKAKMETSFNNDFSDVRMHPESSMASEVGALAYTQGQDVHFAPGQFKPDSSEGHQLIGHELTHVIQQREGRVQPTIEVEGMPVNDDTSLEQEADTMGAKAAG